jgi:excisionase family DNA binding protein
MSAKKYLSLEEAAQILGVRTDEVIRLRERGELRGFADRGTWKFKSDDVEECQRRRQPDSNPDVPLMSEEDDFRPEPASDSDVRLMVADDARKQLTGSSHDVPVMKASDSDSDVRLVGQPKPKKGSDSDVKLIAPKDSDSDVKLSDSDSDVRLASGPARAAIDSDSDVRLAAPPYSDSDVKLLEPSAAGFEEPVATSSDSGAMQAMDAVMSDDEEPLTLHADSGIQLRRPADSGILLEHPRDKDDDSVFKLVTDSSVKVKGGGKSSPRLGQPPKTLVEDDVDSTAPMLLRDEDATRTDPEVPLLLREDDETDLMPKNFLGSGGPDTDSEASVIMFDEEEETVAAPPKRKTGKTDTEDEFDLSDEEELEVSDEVLGEDDELEDLEVFESEDSDFETGVSAADFPVAKAGRVAAPVEHEWGMGALTLTAVSAVILIAGAWIGADLLHTVTGAGGAVSDGWLGMAGALFK